jgi:hypothetical protein
MRRSSETEYASIEAFSGTGRPTNTQSPSPDISFEYCGGLTRPKAKKRNIEEILGEKKNQTKKFDRKKEPVAAIHCLCSSARTSVLKTDG